MGRREISVAASSEPLQQLALWLRSQRQQAGLTYRQMAKITNISGSTLSRAASGSTVPNLKVVAAYARACGSSVERAKSLWESARRADPRVPKMDRPVQRLELIEDFLQLRLSMSLLRFKSGFPSLRELERRAGKYGELPCSTLRLVLKGEAIPSYTLLCSFVEACGVDGDELTLWKSAWQRAYAKNFGYRPPIDHPQPTINRSIWGDDNRTSAHGEQSLAALEQQLESQMLIRDPSHPSVLETRHGIARKLMQERRWDEALVALDALLPDCQLTFGDDVFRVRAIRREISLCKHRQGHHQEAAIRLKSLLEEQIRILGPEDPEVYKTRHNLAHFLAVSGNLSEAVVQMKSFLESRLNRFGSNHPYTERVRDQLANWLERIEKERGAE
ncbi:helix-turn-helix domain-containing protein [Microtetraspora fusca]|uniref:helix-turn-helix domain-containing protein n=1 Tax=Microtetraspora fusca TaxID=1997 RepID=UPI0009FCF38D|nr:helix-turn-helix domain-containing protein [Microtetraspora fusca]